MNQAISEAITRLLNNDATSNTSVKDGQLVAKELIRLRLVDGVPSAQPPAEQYLIVKQTAVDIGAARPELGYAVIPDLPLFDSFESAAAGISAESLPIGWVVMSASRLLPEVALMQSFQKRIRPWMLECFGESISNDLIERNHRFFEESTELVQSTGMTRSEAHQLVDYVFDRPVGEPSQEVGGVMVTLAALCLAAQLDMHSAGETELARIWTKIEQIRAKQAAKPKHSPLPMLPATPDAIAKAAKTVHARIESLCIAANTPDADYFDASSSMLIATRDLLKVIGYPS